MVAGGTAATASAAAVTADIFMFYLAVYKPAHDGGNRNAYYYDNSNIYTVHCLLLRLKILVISNLPMLRRTIKEVTAAITASQMNSVHHQLPTV